MSLSNYPDSVCAADIEDVFGDPDSLTCGDCGVEVEAGNYCGECEEVRANKGFIWGDENEEEDDENA